MSKGIKWRTKLLIFEHWQDRAVTGGCLLVTGSPALRWQEHYTGIYMKREKLPLRCAEKPFRGLGKSNRQKAVIQGFPKEAEA